MEFNTCYSLMNSAGAVSTNTAALKPALAGTELPVAANENIRLKSEWMTPAEALQIIRRIKSKLLAENVQSQALVYSNTQRKIWNEVSACEACLRWTYFRR